MRIGRLSVALLLGIPVLYLVVFFLVPFGSVVVTSLSSKDGSGATVANFARVLTDTYYWETLVFSFKLALWTTLAVLLIGYPLAYTMTFHIRGKLWRRLIFIVVVTPLFTSSIVRAFGWLVLLGRRGFVNETLVWLDFAEKPLQLLFNEFGIVVGLTYIMVPFMVLTVASVLQNLEPALLEAARDLGANPIVAFLKVTFPLSLPGVVAGSLIVFTLSVSAYVTPSILSGGKKTVMSMLIYQQYNAVFDFNFGGALAVVLLVSTLVLIGAYLAIVERYGRTG
jgi:putative spermidine/putrescine transport system permease protein